MIEAVEFKNINEKYVVSSDGLVWRILSDGDIMRIETTFDKFGNERVGIFTRGKYRFFFVHMLVIGSFKGFKNRRIGHKDGNNSNNNLSNLYYY